MKTKACLGLVVLMVFAANLQGESNFGIKFSGYIKTDLIADSRQTVAAREGHFLLYPSYENPDLNGDDANARANLNILAIQTRLKGTVTGPEAFGARSLGIIEGAFFGSADGNINTFRLRHAFLTLAWDRTSVLFGQFWHPMFVTSVYPGTVSFNTGAPFQPFSRNPQIRLTHSLGQVYIIAAAIAQRDFVSIGPNGGSSMYLRNSMIPNIHAQLQYNTKPTILGVGLDWKALTPKLISDTGYKTTEMVSALSFLAYARFNLPNFTWKVEGVYGQNLADHLMLGGYGAESVAPETGIEGYMPTGVYSVWTDISSGDAIGFGLFAGYTGNLGASETLYSFYGRGSNIAAIYRLSPRVTWTSGKTQLAAEVEYTAASYGVPDSDYTVKDAEFVGNLRLLLAAYLFF